MATLLYRLGRFSYRHAWRVIGAWLFVLLATVGAAVTVGGQTQESFAIPGTESQEALDRLEAVFPSVAGASVTVVVQAPEGESVEDYERVIERTADELRDLDGIEAVVGPFDEYAGRAVSDDERMALIRVQFSGATTEVTDEQLAAVVAAADLGRDAGLVVEFSGQVFQENSFGITPTEILGVVIAGVVLLVTFGSLLAAGMPLLSALLGVGIVVGGITTIAGFTTVSSSAPLLALMIGLAVGIDYALFILSRHRTQLAAGEDPEESAAMAVGTAGSAVVFAGVTVIIALLGLLVVNIPFLSVMGVGAAFAVLVAIGVAVTLLPAFLGLAKERLIPKPKRRFRGSTGSTRQRPTMGARWVRTIMKAPWLAVVGVIGVLGTLALPALSLDLNLPNNGSEPAGSTQRVAYDLVTEGFGEGYNGPLIVAVDITQTTDILDDLDAIGDELRRLPDVEYVSQGLPDAGLDTAIIQVVPSSAPDSQETKELVEAIRELAPEIEDRWDTEIFVTGTTAVAIDISNRLTSALVPFGIVVVGLSIVLLMAVFRSVLVPIKAALGFLLSVTASFGVVVAVFQWGWFSDLMGVEQPGPILSFMPIILMAVLFGLAMDYEVFLVSGMREQYVLTGDAKRAVAVGFANGARVVTAAAAIMFFVFFAFVPETSGAIKGIALGLAVGIAFDAFLVRMTLVPALMALFGRAAWWMPKWLQRVLPNVDIEGELLRHHKDAVAWAEGQRGSAISTDHLVVGTRGGSAAHEFGPLSVSIPEGALVAVVADVADRRLLAATLGGRLDPLSGRAQVVGHPLPSEAGRVRGKVALADLGGVERAEVSVTVGELLTERLELTQPWYRQFATGRRAKVWFERINAVLATSTGREMVPVRPASTLTALPQLERAVTLAAIALAERTPVVLLDQLDAFATDADEHVFFTAVRSLAPATTTVVVGVPHEPRTHQDTIDLAALDQRGLAGKAV